jgi:hypothetical protein
VREVNVVVDLRHRERVVIDTVRLDQLFHDLGQRGAENFVMDRVEDIAERLADLEWHYRQNTHDVLAREARVVSKLCTDIGLTSLARVVRDLGVTARSGDTIAVRAVWDRLVRIGDRSLAQVWEVPGLSL